MKMFLYWLSGYLPCRIIANGEAPYLERYYLFTILGVCCYLHRFVGSDPDRGKHDQQWPWACSIILSGECLEVLRSGTRPVRWLNWLTGDTFHRVLLPEGKPCWSLFFHRAAYTKPWEFLQLMDDTTAKKRVPHRYPLDGRGTPDEWWLQVPIGMFEPRRAKP